MVRNSDSPTHTHTTPPTPPMKTKNLVLFFVAVFGLLTLSSCAPMPPGQQFFRAGVFGPGTGQSYRPITGLPGQRMLAQGFLQTNSLCDPRGFQGYGGIQVLPKGSFYSPGHPSRYPSFNQSFGGGCQPQFIPICPEQNWNQRFPPLCPPRPACAGPGYGGSPYWR